MKKNILLSLNLIIILTIHSEQKDSNLHDEKKRHNHVLLTNYALSMIDGIPGFIDAASIRNMVVVIKLIKDIQFGYLDEATNKRVGNYTFQNRKCCLKEILFLEKKLKKENKLDANSKAELDECLTKVKKDFTAATMQFAKDIEPGKAFIKKLLEESLQGRNILESLMYDWFNTPLGKEEEAFNSKITNLETLDNFFTHVTFFLSDLKHSCKKANAQFEEIFLQKGVKK